jgi:hypothetical protein
MKLTKIIAAHIVLFYLLTAVPFCIGDTSNDVFLVPESERPLDFAVIGIWTNSHSYIFSPEIKWPGAPADKAQKELEKDLYFLNLEFTHGEMLQNMPIYTRIYVLVPDKRFVKDATGDEKAYFIEYLKKRCGFTDAQIKNRFQFLYTSEMIVWPQDMCKVIGYNRADGRIAIARSSGDVPIYVKVTKEFTDAFPEKFALKDVGMETSAEGGDEDIVQLPGRRVAIVAGRHRAQRYIERTRKSSYEKSPINDAGIQEAKAAFKKNYYKAPVVFLPEEMLKDPLKGSEEVFHLDMYAGMLPDPKGGQPKAFIPSIMKNCFVSLNDEHLDNDFVSHVQAEYDAAAEQLQKLGFEVQRLVYCDHPVRSPANFLKFHNKITDNYTVMLGKYPNHLPVDDPYTAQHRIVAAFKTVTDRFMKWQKNKHDANYAQLMEVIDLAWKQMDIVSDEDNPMFDEQKKQFEKYGYHVITVPVYAWGAGGLHCLVMY